MVKSPNWIGEVRENQVKVILEEFKLHNFPKITKDIKLQIQVVLQSQMEKNLHPETPEKNCLKPKTKRKS